MATSIDWSQLRSLNGSQQNAFEELCCQLAARETVDPKSWFTRVGAPDAGVECYWTLPSGEELAWQAKFFTTTPGESQWKQLDGSVRTALEKHPKLRTYIVCLPLDRADPRVEKQKWFMDRWAERAQTWEAWAHEQGVAVSFEYWGQSEILERLGREEHRGRYLFWFGKELFSNTWFQARLEESVRDAGPRYTPELHVGLPLSRLFNGLGRVKSFFEQFRASTATTLKACDQIVRLPVLEVTPEASAAFKEAVMHLRSEVDAVQHVVITEPVPWEAFIDASIRIERRADDLIEALEKQRDTVRVERQDQASKPQGDPFSSARSRILRLGQDLYELQQFAGSDEAALANTPYLLVTGDAGTGKTHLLCDAAEQRLKKGAPSVLLLGEKFRDDEPWGQITRLLKLTCTGDELLGALNAAGEARNTRALLLIDALNEGGGRRMWARYLNGLLAAVQRYPHVGLVLSVRSSYRDLVIPEGLAEELTEVTHDGFASHELQATRTFFEHYGLEQPSVPLLVPEFSNPLFLKLFCLGLQKAGLHRMPKGLEGVTQIFGFFMDRVNKRLAAPDYLDFNPKSRLVQGAVRELAGVMTARGFDWLPIGEAEEVLQALHSSHGYEKSLYQGLVSEGVLAEDRFLTKGEGGTYQDEEGVRFTYERLFDHLAAQRLLDVHLDREAPEATFGPGGALGYVFRDLSAARRNQGLI